jgi:hypothetical protein
MLWLQIRQQYLESCNFAMNYIPGMFSICFISDDIPLALEMIYIYASFIVRWLEIAMLHTK